RTTQDVDWALHEVWSFLQYIALLTYVPWTFYYGYVVYRHAKMVEDSGDETLQHQPNPGSLARWSVGALWAIAFGLYQLGTLLFHVFQTMHNYHRLPGS
ncbi:MAG: hypothetical protein ACRDQH_05425, partial [Pseudonocardiaceae bacterium]